MKKILTLIFALVLCVCVCFGATVYAEEPATQAEKVMVANISGGNRLTFNTDTDFGSVLVQYLSLPKNFSGSKYYTIGNSLTETSEGSADVVLTGGGDGEFVLKYVGKLEKEQNTIIKIGENVTLKTDDGDVKYSVVKLSLVYGGVKKESTAGDGNITVTIESDNATIIQSGANNVEVLGASSLIDLTGEKDSTDTPAGSSTSEAKNDGGFSPVLAVVLILIVIAGALAVMYFTLPAFKEKVDNLLGKNKKRPTKRR